MANKTFSIYTTQIENAMRCKSHFTTKKNTWGGRGGQLRPVYALLKNETSSSRPSVFIPYIMASDGHRRN